MQGFQTFYYLDEDAPDIVLFEISLLFLMLGYFLEKITVVCIFHHDAENALQALLIEKFLNLPQ